MARNQGKVGEAKSEVVAEIPMACVDEVAATEFFERRRWNGTPCCPTCGSTNVYMMRDSKTGQRQKNLRWRCREKACTRQQFTARTGTVMEDSRIPLRHWCFALWAACSSKKGVSALQISRQTGLSYKSALFLMHRIRFAMAPANAAEAQENGKLGGIVEADETYVGGKPRNRIPSRGYKGRNNYQTRADRKVPVFAAVERDGRVRVRVLADVTAKTLAAAVREHIDNRSRLMTDEAPVYKAVGREFASHEKVPHKNGIYAVGDVTTNTIEGFFSLLKRGVYGTFHNVSRKHLQRYCDEFEFRYNARKMDDGARTVAAIQGAVGKKLYYRDLIA